MLPVLARTVLGLYRSTASVETSTASAPNASAQRITVPRLPGSRTWSQNTTRRAPGVSASASGTSTVRQTASSPCGVTVSVSSPTTSAGSVPIGIAASVADRSRSWW